jgi:flagellar motor switch protein FliM
MSGIYKDTEISLFRDMTSPLRAVRAYADEAGEGGEDLEGGSSEESVVFHRPEGLKTEVPAGSIHTYTAGKQAALSSTEVHRFQSENGKIVRSLAARLSLFLRMEMTLEQVSLEVKDLTKYASEHESPRHMILFKVHPLEAVGVLDVSTPLLLTIADRMLGGKAFSVNPDRSIREIETALMDQIAQLFLREWSRSWRYEEPLRTSLIGHEVDPQHLQIGGPEDTFYHVSIEASLGDCIDQMQMLLPVRSIDPVVRHLTQATMVAETEEDINEHEEYVRQHWNPLFNNLPVKIVAQWPGIPVMARDVSAFKEGDIIPLEPERLSNVRVSMAGKLKYICRLGSLDKKCAVEILRRITK